MSRAVSTAVDAELLFRAERTAPLISTDGTRLAFLARDDDGLHLEIAGLDLRDPSRIASRPMGALRSVTWADDRHIVFSEDNDGDENWRLLAADIETGEVRGLTPERGVQARLLDAREGRVLVAMNADEPARHDAYLIDVDTGSSEKLVDNPGFARFIFTPELEVRGGVRPLDDGGISIELRDGDSWRGLLGIGPDDTGSGDLLGGPLSRPVALSADGRSLFIATSMDSDRVRLLEVDVTGGERKVLAEDPEHDLGGKYVFPATFTPAVLFDQVTGRPLLAGFPAERLRTVAVDGTLQADLDRLTMVDPGDLFVESRSADGGVWVVGFDHDAAPVTYWLYDRRAGTVTKLFDHLPELNGVKLATMEPFQFTARDGLAVHGYLTFPPGGARSNLPAVLLVHGGPWARDWWGFDPTVQFLATRGYLVVQVNFRGSTGYGKAFVNAGDRGWGGAMQDDLTEGVHWCVSRGLADPDRVAIFGGSYGGYAALAGATFTPDLYRAVIAGAAPANLVTFIEAFPPYWGVISALFRRRVGDPAKDRDFLLSRSPAEHVDAVRAPVLLAHGANDPRVKLAETQGFAEGLARRGVEHELVIFEDEGHDIAKPTNRLRYLRAVEAFLYKHVPIDG